MNRRFTWVELLVVIIIIAILVGLIPTAVNASREASRRAACINKLRQFGLGLQSYESSNGAFPPSASVAGNGPGKPATVGGWSFLARILPFLGYGPMYQTLPLDVDPEWIPDNRMVRPAIEPITNLTMETSIPGFVCPSNGRNSLYQDPNSNPPTGAFTNYKAMGASTKNSLKMAVDPSLPPPYGTASLHPDGVMFPGKGTRRDEISDGLGYTIATIETIDDTWSRWTVGREVTSVGLPQKSSPTGSTPQPPLNYFVPPGFDGKFGPGSAVAKAGLRTFLAYDFSSSGLDAGTYEDPGFARNPPAYGPSSMHPAIVNCGFADGSARSLSKQIDAAALFFLITKNNNDPSYAP